MCLAGEIADMLADSVLASIFGLKNVQRKIIYSSEGQKSEVSIGKFLKQFAGRFISKIYHPLRNIFDIFDYVNLGFDERENEGNVQRFK